MSPGPAGMAARGNDAGGVAAADLAEVIDWLAAQFIRPPTLAQVQAARSVAGQMLLREMGQVLGDEALMSRLEQRLSEGADAEVATELQRRYTLLFEGIFPPRCVLPYASAWQESGRLYGEPVTRMQTLLAALDVAQAQDCREPPDHLGVQLAALAEALRRGRRETVQALQAELAWVGPFCHAMARVDGEGYYGVMAEVLPAALARVAACNETGQED